MDEKPVYPVQAEPFAPPISTNYQPVAPPNYAQTQPVYIQSGFVQPVLVQQPVIVQGRITGFSSSPQHTSVYLALWRFSEKIEHSKNCRFKKGYVSENYGKSFLGY